MGRRKPKSALDSLNMSFKAKKTGTGLLSTVSGLKRGKRRKNGGLVAASGFGKKSDSGMMGAYNRHARKDRRSRGMDGMAARSLKERMTRTEYLKIRDEMEQTIRNDDGLSSEKAQNELIQNEPWYRRVLVMATRRFRKPVL
jgi:hypothetical protein